MQPGRILCWFSCGAASAVAAKRVLDSGEPAEVVYCDTSIDEHPDNRRFLADCERWFGQAVIRAKSREYADKTDVFRRTRWLIGPKGARCTTELKKRVREAYQRPDDLHVFGFTFDEAGRVARFRQQNPDIRAYFPLVEAGLTKRDCHRALAAAGIEQPAMYRLGYKNNNCIGCVKGQAGYWNKIRVDFPEEFARMAAIEREIGAAICKTEPVGPDGRRQRIPIYLDELPPNAGRYKTEPDIECGVLCQAADPAADPA